MGLCVKGITETDSTVGAAYAQTGIQHHGQRPNTPAHCTRGLCIDVVRKEWDALRWLCARLEG